MNENKLRNKYIHSLPAYPYIILFDGVCNLCNGAVRFIIQKDKTALFRFAAIQSETGQLLVKRYAIEKEEEKDMSSIYYIRKNECFRKSTAILHILKDMGKGWKFLFPLIHIPVTIRDSLYLWVSRNRYKLFGKKQACMVPTPDIRSRFL